MNRPHSASGFSLVEVLVTVVILGAIAAAGGGSLLNLARRERANTVVSELAGWLEQASRDASRFQAGAGQPCTVTITNGSLAPGAVMASIAPAACATQTTLTVPDLAFNAPTAQINANPTAFVFTPRGTVAPSAGGAALPAAGITINVTVNNERPLRCVRLLGLLGVLEVGRNNQAAAGACTEWSRI
ncbi:MAG: prepilin-type N-terminal cleavage/methylation domain-containing protein [Cyanobacteria bacterium J06638_7]